MRLGIVIDVPAAREEVQCVVNTTASTTAVSCGVVQILRAQVRLTSACCGSNAKNFVAQCKLLSELLRLKFDQ